MAAGTKAMREMELKCGVVAAMAPREAICWSALFGLLTVVLRIPFVLRYDLYFQSAMAVEALQCKRLWHGEFSAISYSFADSAACRIRQRHLVRLGLREILRFDQDDKRWTNAVATEPWSPLAPPEAGERDPPRTILRLCCLGVDLDLDLFARPHVARRQRTPGENDSA